ncbi:putative GTPase NOG2 [Sugiyamaella lignohabitans]|uniref:Nucleolar GTP-binding protein 2 n=1 Tax=Sugiyamaella lignohabitans TaxID=796027 RepID=A0A167F3F6_9ASCO|nr:putative GTPase NOG2 [Sugiyamaella lignohabitans]ANB14779.1 putative GTPase NOG2 [Sugiyamaella lignohabitans]
MGTGKKEKSRRAREGTELSSHGNLRVKGENFYRDGKKVKKLSMYKEGRAQRNAKGEITQAASFQSTEIPNARVEPNRKWFGNTRVIAQDALNHFRESLGAKTKDSYQVLLRRNKLPMSLLEEASHDVPTVDILSNEPFDQTFGPKSQRKKPRTVVSSLDDLVTSVDEDLEKYEENVEHQKLLSGALGAFGDNSSTAGVANTDGFSIEAKEHIFSKGQSKRIWNELYKVIDSSDVVIHVLDARDPMGTRCTSVEQYIKKEAPHKHLIFVLNKCDLVPNWVSVSFGYYGVGLPPAAGAAPQTPLLLSLRSSR